MNKASYRLIALLFGFVLPFIIGGKLQAEKLPNIVLIISDDQHWGDYGFMGHPVVKTPCLDRLSQEGLVFTRGYVPSSLCSASLASIVTGQFPHSHRITGNDPPMPPGMQRGDFHQSQAWFGGRNVLIERMKELPTLPRLLAEKGYLSLQTGKWWMGRYDSGGFTHGMTQGERHGDVGLRIGRETMQPMTDFFDLAVRENKPFFLWYAPMLPHDPHDPPQRLLDRYTDKTDSIHQARYWGNVERFDETCGQLFEELDKRGLSENTVIVYVTDNGWIQSQDNPRYAPKSKQSQYDGGLRTPIIIRWPGKIRPERNDTHLASSVDIMPTFLSIAGISAPDSLPGINLLDKEAVTARKAIYGECFTHDIVDLYRPERNLRFRWLLEGDWKLIVAQPGEETGIELYNVIDDPYEERNLASEQTQRVAEMLPKLNAWYPLGEQKIIPKILIAEDGRSFQTEFDEPYVPFGVNYFRPGTGWAPQIWKTFDEAEFRKDFALMKDTGINCVRVFLTYGSFMTEKGKVDPEGLAKFDTFLTIAEEYGIYVHPTGPDHWEGPGVLGDYAGILERYTDDEILEATTLFWKEFAARYKGRNIIFAYDLLNEPSIPWESVSLKPKWNKWLKNRYHNAEEFAQKRNLPLDAIQWGNEDAPRDFSNRELVLDYQHFREEQADHWTKIQVEAIKSVDPDALVTVGLIQWSVPAVHPGLQHYAAFKPSRQASYLDFMEIHFYPLATGFYEYEKEGDTERNLAYIESIVKEVAATGKPVVIAEFGWYGGGKLKNSNQERPAATEEQQAAWNTALFETTKGLAVGWLNWGFFDMPEAGDISELLGLYTADRKPKAWGIAFKTLSEQLSGQVIPPKPLRERPEMDWDLLISDPQAAPKFQAEYFEAFRKDNGNRK